MKTVEKTWNMLFVISNEKQEDLLLKYAKVSNVVLENHSVDNSHIYSIKEIKGSQKEFDRFINTLDVKEVFKDCYIEHEKGNSYYIFK